jgi:hypothetical protein
MYSYKNRVDVFGAGITLSGRAEPNQAVTGPYRPQLYTVLGSWHIKLPDPHRKSHVWDAGMYCIYALLLSTVTTRVLTFERLLHTRRLRSVKLQKRPIRSPCLWGLTAQRIFHELSQSGVVPLRFIDKFQLTRRPTHVFARISNAIREIFTTTTNFSNKKWRDKRYPRLVHENYRLSCGFRDEEIIGIYVEPILMKLYN